MKTTETDIPVNVEAMLFLTMKMLWRRCDETLQKATAPHLMTPRSIPTFAIECF